MKKWVRSGLGVWSLVLLAAGGVFAAQGGEQVVSGASEALLSYCQQKNADPEVIADLVNRGADVNFRDPKDGATPLHCALRYMDNAAARALLALGADIRAKDRDGRTPLHDAVSYMVYDVAQRLVEQGAELNIKDVEGRPPLYNVIFWDARQRAVDLVHLFARYGFDFQKFTDADFLNQAIGRGRGEIALIFLKNGVPFNDASLYEAARTGQEELFRLLLEKGARPSTEKILHDACQAGNLTIIKALTEKGVKPTEQDIDFCLFNGHKEAALFLNPILKKEQNREVDIRGRCPMVPQDGPCKALFWVAYYDSLAGKCREFAYGGCGGVTPFESLDACRRVCEE
ncbi:MAG: ankyrin repeat domain-containing protein [Deltaproteobacteria bacterium]|nr:ankyrin repeat domain-containing protein [Deltaproteobacteria bacterium]